MYILVTSISVSIIVLGLVLYVLSITEKTRQAAIAARQIENNRLRDALIKKKRDSDEAAHQYKLLLDEDRRRLALKRKAELEEERIANEAGPKFYVATYSTIDDDIVKGTWTVNLDDIEYEKSVFKSKRYIKYYRETHMLSQEFVNQLAVDCNMSVADVLDQTPLPL